MVCLCFCSGNCVFFSVLIVCGGWCFLVDEALLCGVERSYDD